MTPHKYVDTYKETIAAIKAHVLANAPRGLTERCRREVSDESTYKWLQFERAGSNVTLSLDLDWDSEIKVDGDGNEWTAHKFKAELNWPCHGATSPAVAAARLALYSDVTAYAAELVATFDRVVWRLHRSVEQVAEAKAANERAKKLSEVCDWLRPIANMVRIGKVARFSTANGFARAEPGDRFEIALGGKHYVVQVDATEVGSLMASVTRVEAPAPSTEAQS